MQTQEGFHQYMNAQHPNMNFTYELEENGSLAFLVTRDLINNIFITSVYRKPTFSEVYTNFYSFIPSEYKSGLVYTLLYGSYQICTNWHQIHAEFDKICLFMQKNGYPSALIDRTVSYFLNKLYANRPSQRAHNDNVKTHQILLPYLGAFTKRVERKIQQGLKEHMPNNKFVFFLQSPNTTAQPV